MAGALVWIIAGLIVLVVGAELLVRSGTALAARIGISPMIVGLTVVAIGTSTPELAVGIDAALQGNGSLAVGNIAGTNTVNILLILGLSAAIRPLALRMETLRLDLPVIVVSSFALMVLAWDGVLTRTDGAMLLASAVVFTFAVIRVARRERYRVKVEFAREFGAQRFAKRNAALEMLMLLSGIGVIVVGADWLVDGAIALARLWSVSDAFIGLTIVAIGTSAPELVTTLISTIRCERDIAIGNLLGSSIYNILVILGVTCLFPSTGIAVGPQLIQVDIPVMIAVALVCVPVFISGREVTRVEGALFVVAYAVYLAFLIVDQT